MKREDDEAPETLTVMERDVGSSDNGESIQIYMKSLQKIPLLSKEAEITLARQIKVSKATILQLCQSCPEGISELYLLSQLPMTELRKLFHFMIEEGAGIDGTKEIPRLLKKFEKLLSNKLEAKKKASEKLLEFLNLINFTLNDLRNVSKPILEFGSAQQAKALKKELVTFQTSKNKLIEGNLRLVFSRAKIFMNKGLSLEDLIQEGNIGLIKAIEKFDVEKGYKFGTYATWWIDQALGRSVADKSRLIRIPVHMVENINKLTKVSRTLTQKLGRDPKIDELSGASSLSEEKIAKVRKVVTFPTSMEETSGDIGIPLSEYLVDVDTPDPYEVLEKKEIALKVRLLLSKLSPREEKIMRMRFGIGERRPTVLDAIGTSLGVSRERIRQIEVQSANKIVRIANGPRFQKEWETFKKKGWK